MARESTVAQATSPRTENVLSRRTRSFGNKEIARAWGWSEDEFAIMNRFNTLSHRYGLQSRGRITNRKIRNEERIIRAANNMRRRLNQ